MSLNKYSNKFRIGFLSSWIPDLKIFKTYWSFEVDIFAAEVIIFSTYSYLLSFKDQSYSILFTIHKPFGFEFQAVLKNQEFKENNVNKKGTNYDSISTEF